ncbi:glycerate kinase [Myxococcota bacterium]|nr:glycerate kinase [Myxococcota bacterium]MBU1382038.1 glycerate kinase [Myxococcota bacterium]MBU1495320.1 glycerate kinase [Myxococcota bacterium]
MNILISSDSFKSVASSEIVNDIIGDEIKKLQPDSEIVRVSVADGGEGTSKALSISGGYEIHHLNTVDPLRRDINLSYYVNETQKTVILDSADTIGYQLLKSFERKPIITSSEGLGRALSIVFDRHEEMDVICALGGTATIDGGKDAMSALGFEFRDFEGNYLSRGGGSLPGLSSLSYPESFDYLASRKVKILHDVLNPLMGKSGAAEIFGPQKGARTGEIEFFSLGLKNLARIVSMTTGVDFVDKPGYGAAGGICILFNGILGWDMYHGAPFILDWLGYDEYLKWADLVITGEGCFDLQSLSGKITGEIIKRAEKAGKKMIIISGRGSEAIHGFPVFNIDPPEEQAPSSLSEFEEKLRNCIRRLSRELWTLRKS